MRDDDERDYGELEVAWEERQARFSNRCKCGYPDWPGQCPGPAACPVHGENDKPEDDS